MMISGIKGYNRGIGWGFIPGIAVLVVLIGIYVKVRINKAQNIYRILIKQRI
jgi:hypothetical protein